MRPSQSRATGWKALWTGDLGAPLGAISWRATQAVALRTLCCAIITVAVLLNVRAQPHTDLYPSYVAAVLANESEWSHIYHPSVWLQKGVDPEWDERARALINAPLRATSFVYHPWYLSALRPLVAHIDYATFQDLSLWSNRACVVLIGLALAVLLRWESLNGQLLLTLLVGCASATRCSIDLGQNGLPALVLALAAALSWQRGAPLLLGGFFAGLAWVFKPWCVTILMLCFLLRGIRAGVLTTAILVGLMILLPEIVLPSVLMRDYHAMNHSLTKIFIWGENNHSVLSIIERGTRADWSKHLRDWHPTTPSVLHRAAALSVSGLALTAGAIAWWRQRPSSDWTIAAWLAFMILPLGITWDHYFIFALPLALLATFSRQTAPGVRALGVALLSLVMAMLPIYEVSKQQASEYLKHPAGAPWLRAVPMLLLIVSFLAALRFGGQRFGGQRFRGQKLEGQNPVGQSPEGEGIGAPNEASVVTSARA